ncbi:translation factor GTPase family protein [uncultured Bifidobacterium sp.]|uniref:elongation factor G n=1 Tax=uncultured Bifidobacterium sp. TaxID=165187 RepID=UPI00258A114B|nr:TetM/TetW/TetO/TetS family tetracycline resistance ribosomal protection protein [uncultured Bifidobacterium sp.]
MTHIVAGILAHVDAGKTTLSEALLYRSGGIRKLGRVDHGDAFLDTESLEKQRGITIHAHQASVRCGNLDLTLLDTPGHVDFAAETERVLRVLDYAILVVSGTDGVQGHTETLWRLLARYQVPTFIFVNKMDAAGADRAVALADLRRRLSDAIYELPMVAPDSGISGSVPLIEAAQWRQAEDAENVATLDESAMDEYLETGGITLARLRTMIAERKLFPVFFGSALKVDGVDEFMAGLEAYVREPQWPAEFGARIYKISHDAQHNRLTWLKVTGGVLKAKALLADADGTWQEKADQVRVYNGAKFDIATDIPAGGVCAVTGLTRTFPGEGLGIEPDAESPTIQPVLTYTVLPPDTDLDALAERAAAARTAVSTSTEQGEESDDEQSKNVESEADSAAPPMPSFDDLTLHKVITALRELEDEDPLLHVVWQERLREVHVQLMGAVQLEIIQQELHDRFGLDVVFGPGGILYRETITAPIEGVGHFEPLRHYAEAHIRLEPGELGSGVRIATAVSENVLDRNWQRLIMTHLGEREHLGVLIGAPLTDVKLTLVGGRAHLKHTEGGDFRQATYRAIRQGLMELRVGVEGRPSAAEGQTDADFVKEAMDKGRGYCRVLEPWYRFRLEVPQDMVGRAMSDIQRMAGTFEMGDDTGAGFGSGTAASAGSAMDADYAVLTGECPVSEMRDYAMDVNAYTHGRGRLSCTFAGYRPCHDEERVVLEAHYDPEADLDNTPDSVFCAHGAGYPVKWYKVPEFAHVEYVG